MKIGVPKEIKTHEYRVGMTPHSVKAYAKNGHSVLVEKGAGIGSGYEDAEYVSAGARIIADKKDLFQQSEMIVKVKEPLAEEFSLFREGQILFTYLHLAPLQLGLNVEDLFSRSDIAGFLGNLATSLGFSLFGLIQVLIYVGFLLAEQNDIGAKFGRLQIEPARKEEGHILIRTIARQIQSYLGICTVLSTVMGVVCYALLVLLGVKFAAFWALLVFILTYIPTIGAVAVVAPALMALVQFGTFGPALIVIFVLGALHFALMNVAATLILGQSLNLSPFAIILALTFWGLVWGLGGLFLAVPMTAAIAIICAHIDRLRWVSMLLAAPPPRRRRGHGAQNA